MVMQTPDQKARFKKAVALGSEGKLDKAAEIFVSLTDQFSSDFNFLILAGRQLEVVKRLGKAHDIYAKAMKLNPDNYLSYAMLGALYVELEKYPFAVKTLEKAVELSPDDPDLHFNLALACQLNHDIDKAIKHLEITLALGGRAHLAFGTLSRIYEQTNKMEKVKVVLDTALHYFPDDCFLNFTAAVFERRNKNYEKALKYLDKSLSSKEMKDKRANSDATNEMTMGIGFEYGRNYDKLGEYDKAYAVVADANERAGNVFFLKVPEKKKSLKTVANFRTLDLDNWSETTAEPLSGREKAPVFLVGFPRSGTTLLNLILDGHSKLEVLEEEPFMAAVMADIERNFGGVFEGLKTLDQKTLTGIRDKYMNEARELKTKKGKILFIDKLPLHIVQVPLIRKIFPDAKIILALRHPCDCTLSCFMQNFGLNNAMMNFLSLDDATYYYDQVFSLWLHYEKKLDLDIIKVRYEDVVIDLEKEARAVISFLGLPWEDSVLNYRELAMAKKRINTPSYSQVVQPIYKDSSGRWKHYQKYLDPYLDRLAPYCEAFGYSL